MTKTMAMSTAESALEELHLDPVSDMIEVTHDERTYYASFVRINDEVASHILKDYNGHNRHRANATVLRYAESMRAKKWQVNGSTIVFSLDPIALEDGQHRLEAIVVTKVPQLFLVVLGVPFDRFVTIDTGQGRNLRHGLQVEGRDFADVRNRLVSHLHRFERDVLGTKTAASPSIEEGLAIHKRYQTDIDRAVKFISGISRWRCGQRVLSRDIAALVYIFMARVNEDVATYYLTSVISNEGPPGSSIPVVVSKLNDITVAGKNDGTVIADKIATLCMGWVSFAAGNAIKTLKAANNKASQTTIEWLTNLSKPSKFVAESAAAWTADCGDALAHEAEKRQRRYQQYWTARNQDQSGIYAQNLRTRLRTKVAERRKSVADANKLPDPVEG